MKTRSLIRAGISDGCSRGLAASSCVGLLEKCSLKLSGVSQRKSLYTTGNRYCTSSASEMCKALCKESEST